MRLLVTGTTGMLGSSMVPILREKGFEVIPSNFIYAHMDIRKKEEVMKTVRLANPSMIIHLAAETDVDRCEREPEYAFQVNTIGTNNIVDACLVDKIPLLYVSTIGVFYGDKKEPYIETDEPRPVNVYGRTKLMGERLVEEKLRDYYIVRAGWMMGGGPTRDKKFVGKIIRQLQSFPAEIKAVIDKVGSPTYAVDFSNVVSDLIETEEYGLYHCTNHGYPSRYGVAKEIVRLIGHDNSDGMGLDTKVIPVDSSAFSSLSVGRANSEMSDNKCLQGLGLDSMRDWKVALKEYIENEWCSS